MIPLIDRIWGEASRNYSILVTTRRGEGVRLAREEIDRGSDLIVAVGGDGTLNEVVRGVLDSEACVGLIPAGSGNGFARHWGMALDLARACRDLLHPRLVRCDVGLANERLFMVTFGCGLDAHISDRYARSTVRGTASYFYHGFRAFAEYRGQAMTVSIDGKKKYSGQPLLLTLANTRGYGGGTAIAPQARADDGLLDLCILDSLSFKDALYYLPYLFNGTIQDVPGYRHFQIREAVIERAEDGPIHVDGEPFSGDKQIRVSILPGAVSFALPT